MTECEKFETIPSEQILTELMNSQAKEIERLRQQLAEKVEHINILNSHVAESLQLLGVETGVNGYIPDSWMLREQCKIAGDKIRDRDERLRVCGDYEDWHPCLDDKCPYCEAARQACREG